MILVGISGKRRSGKDLLASFLVKEYGFTQVSLALPLKNLCKTMFGLTEDQVNGPDKEKPTCHIVSPRHIMIETGKFFRTIYPDVWVDQLSNYLLNDCKQQKKKYVISDVRFSNEADWVKENGGYLIRLERAVELTGEPIDDPSETQLDHYEHFDLRVPESMNVDAADMAYTAERVNELIHGRISA